MRVKICGVTTVADAESCVAAGADLVGVNLCAGSPRRVDLRVAREIADAIRGRAEVVGVVADEDLASLRHILAAVGLDRLQLHGDESPELVRSLAPLAFKALRIGDAADVAKAALYDGEILLLDARVPGMLGGTGKTLDVTLAEPVARARPVLLAGGLGPDNVAAAIAAVRPWGVDAASGVESRPGVKDPVKVAAFVRAARSG